MTAFCWLCDSSLIGCLQLRFSRRAEIERQLIFPRVLGFFAWLGLGLAFYTSHFPESVFKCSNEDSSIEK